MFRVFTWKQHAFVVYIVILTSWNDWHVKYSVIRCVLYVIVANSINGFSISSYLILISHPHNGVMCIHNDSSYDKPAFIIADLQW